MRTPPAPVRRLAALLFAAALAPVPAQAAPELTEKIRVFENLQEVIVQVSSQVKPWVVHIEAVQKRGDQKYKVVGSGLILSQSGYILTNNHLTDEAKLVTVTLPDGNKLEARVIGSDKQTDLAVLKIEPKTPCPEPKLGDSNRVSVGEWIIAVGNPYGFDRTVYFGIVSGKGRTLASLNPYQDSDSGFEFTTDFIQTDASIDPGSSGGPLVNLRGEVIGINSMGLGRGMSFTIPINTAKSVAEKLMSKGKLARGWIGVSLQPLTRELAGYFRLTDGGVLVSEVLDDSPARKAGFQQGDIILELNGKKLKAENEEELNQVSQVIWSSEAGSRLSARLFRGGKAVVLAVTVGEQPRLQAREVETAWGFNVKEITQDIYRDYLLESREGVLVSFVETGTAAGEARLREGDVIMRIEDTPVASLSSFEKIYGGMREKTKQALVLVKRRKDAVFVLLELDKYRQKNRN
jgi:serine protease Do